MGETRKFLRNEWMKIPVAYRKALFEQVKQFLQMITEDRDEQRIIIHNFLLYIDDINKRTGNTIPYDISKLHPAKAVFSVFYHKLPRWLFVEAWTFAISVFNYTKAFQKITEKETKYDSKYMW